MGIGIVAENYDRQVVAQWTMQEYSLGNKLEDQMMIVKLALCTTSEYQRTKIQFRVPQQHLLKMIRNSRAKGVSLFSHLEDISSLSSMFVECSFVLCTNENSVRISHISNYALSIPFDGEWINPQCFNALV